MSGLREDGNQREGGPVVGPFAKTEFLRLVGIGCDRLSCSTEGRAFASLPESFFVEAHFGPGGPFEWTYVTFESGNDYSKRSEGFEGVLWICIPTNVREVRARCFYQCESLHSVSFGGSSKLERLCSGAFCGTSIESLSIPDSVVEVGARCFYECKSLRSVSFGSSSKVERLCAEAFCGTSIESLSIPDSVVEVGFGCFYQCKSLRSVSFGSSLWCIV